MNATSTPCDCSDPDVAELQRLVARGFDQVEVSHLLWGDPSKASPALVAAHAGIETRHRVREAFKARFPWLRLPLLLEEGA